MPRFFRRLAEGVFDIDDLKRRTEELAQFIAAARAAYGIDKPIAVGFSNGANIAASLLLTRPETLAGAVLMRATVPFVPETLPHLAGMPVLILSGAMDPMVSADKRERLAQLLAAAGANVEAEVIPTGHNLTAQDISSGFGVAGAARLSSLMNSRCVVPAQAGPILRVRGHGLWVPAFAGTTGQWRDFS